MTVYEKLCNIYDQMREKTDFVPDVALVLGSGLGRFGEQVEVVVASRTISAGETVTEGSIETKLWLADLLPEGAVTSEVEVLGRQLGSSVLKGEVVSSQRLAKSRRLCHR